MRKHEWELFKNPRNGRVQVMACGVCGVTKGLEAVVQLCRPSGVEGHRMLKAGWLKNTNSKQSKSGLIIM